MVDTLYDILKHFEKQTQPNVIHNHNRQKYQDTPVNIMSYTQQRDTNTNRIEVNNEQEDPNYMTVKCNSD